MYRYLTDKASRDLNFYLTVGFLQKIYWCADAWGAELVKDNRPQKAEVLDLLKECEHRMINKVENVMTDLKSTL